MVERSDEAHNAVDDGIARAYVGFIHSVPHGTPPVRHNGIRSAHSADAPRARFRATLHDIAVDSQSLLAVLRAQDRARHEAAFTSGMIAPWFH
jgi:hypothetical protein